MKNVSVIIPVFNAVKFVREAVESALFHDCVGEVILVEDNSIDNSYKVCQLLHKRNPRVKLYIHRNHENRGAGASRNFGIINAKYPFIAFLDADDYFLPNRFEKFNEYLDKRVEFDGIYEAAVYETSNRLYSIHKPIPDKKLFHYLIRGTFGHFCTNGIIVKKALVEKSGFFNEELRLHQDSELWLRLAYYGKLVPGNLDNAVAVIRKHEGNRIWKGTSVDSRIMQWSITLNWAKSEKVNFIDIVLIKRKLAKLQSIKKNQSFIKTFFYELFCLKKILSAL